MAQAAAGDARSKSWEPRACAEHGDVGAAYVCVGTVWAESSVSGNTTQRVTLREVPVNHAHTAAPQRPDPEIPDFRPVPPRWPDFP